MIKIIVRSLLTTITILASLLSATLPVTPVSAKNVAANSPAGVTSFFTNSHDVAITSLTAPQFAKPGENITYLIHCKSNGLDSGAKITDTLPASVYFVSTSCNLIDYGNNLKCAYNDSTRTVSWDVLFNAGASFIIYITVTVAEDAPANSLITNAADIEPNGSGDDDYGNNHKEATTQVTSIMNNQRRNLDSKLNSTGNPVMVTSRTQTGSVAIEHGDTVTWLSDQKADTPVVFDTGAWTVRLSGNLFGICLVRIGETDGTPEGFVVFSGSERLGIAVGKPLTIDISLDHVQVNPNNHLALQISNYGTGSVFTDGSSYLKAPSSTPALPLPELSAGWLLGLGLAGVGAYIIIKRRRVNSRIS